MNFKGLDWDTDFFGFNVARINDGIDLAAHTKIFEELSSGDIRLAYYSSPSPLDMANDLYEIKLVDRKTTYLKNVLPTRPQDGVLRYDKDYPEENL
ncbi:MAG: hypothetical protein ACOYLO_15655, partial [Ferruginibacter sp.]